MLVLTRKPGQSIKIGTAVVTILKSNGGRVSIGIEAPDGVKILRSEIEKTTSIHYNAKEKGNDA